MEEALDILNKVKTGAYIDGDTDTYEKCKVAIMKLEVFCESLEMMQKLGEELKGINPELTIVKLVQAALKER